MAKLENSLLYSYIQMAYEFIRELDLPQIDGKRSEFISALYRSRFNAILENKKTALDKPLELNELSSWFKSLHLKHEDRFIPGKMEELNVNDDSQEAWLALLSQYAENFTRDLTQDDGPILNFGTDSYATYLPIHFFFEPDKALNSHWGIYISESGIAKLAAALKNSFEQDRNFGKLEKEEDNRLFLKAAYQILLRHELLHFRIESFALNAEMIMRKPFYVPYLINVYANFYNTDECLEEALANATVLDSNIIRDMFKVVYPKRGSTLWQQVVSQNIFDLQPKGYNNYHLEFINSDEWEGKYTNRSYASSWNTVLRSRSPRRQLAMNYLCNQILVNDGNQVSNLAPFFAFLPDNYFLRAENLVPIHIVQTLKPEDSFIRQATPKMRNWIPFIKKIGYTYARPGNGDHEIWEKDGFPMLTLNPRKDELDLNSLKSSLKSMGITWRDYMRYHESGKLPESLSAQLKQENSNELARK